MITPAAILYDANGNPIGSVLDGSDYRLAVDASSEIERRIISKTVSVNYRKVGADDGDYFLLIDLDNAGGSGPYLHESGDGIKVTKIRATLIKDNVADQIIAFMGVILSIDATEATIGYTKIGTIGLRDTLAKQADERLDFYPNLLDLTVSSGSFDKIATSYEVTTTDLKTSSSIPDVGGTNRTPAVGDLVLKIERKLGSDTALFHYFLSYFVE